MKKTERKTKTTPVKYPGRNAGPAETGSSSWSNSKGNSNNEEEEAPSLTEIKELIEFVSEKGFNEFELERGGFRLRWSKGLGQPVAPPSQQALYVPQPAGA